MRARVQPAKLQPGLRNSMERAADHRNSQSRNSTTLSSAVIDELLNGLPNLTPLPNTTTTTTKIFKSTNNFHLLLNPTTFLACWWVVFMLHAIDIAFLVATFWLYYWILHDAMASYFLFGNLTFEISEKALVRMNWGFAIVALLHIYVVARMLYRSFKAEQLIFSDFSHVLSSSSPPSPTPTQLPVAPAVAMAKSLSTKSMSTPAMLTSIASPIRSLLVEPSTSSVAGPQLEKKNHRSSKSLCQCLVNCCCCCVHSISKSYEFVMTKCIRPYFFIRGKHFDDMFLVHECFELGCQVYQARRMSVFVATRWINNVFVGLIFFNAISTPLIHNRVISASNMPLRRLVSLTMSTFLNFINAVVIPLVIFNKYIRAYDPGTHFFVQEHLFDDVWYAKSIRENQQLFVTSYLDFISSLWPHISLFNCLRICESMLHRDRFLSRSPVAHRASTKVSPNDPPHQQQPRGSELKRARSSIRRVSDTLERVTALGLRRTLFKQKLAMVFRFLLYNVLWLSGVVVLAIHIDSQSAPRVNGCRLDSTPWFTSGGKSACVIMNVNCYRRGIDGNASQVDTILSQLDTNTMFILSFTHCPALEMPPSVREFNALNGIDIYNSTLTHWPSESAVSPDAFPQLSYVYLVRSNLSSIPEGLVYEPLPPTVLEIYLYGTNLSLLPGIVQQKWTELPILCLEFSQFQVIPPVLEEMQVQFVYMTGNPVVGMTDQVNLLGHENFLDFRASKSPFETLPETDTRLNRLAWLYLEYTNLDHVPEYIQQWYLASVKDGKAVEHSLYGSPYCQLALEDDSQESNYQAQVCAKDCGSSIGFYPIDYIIPQRPL